MVHMQQGMCISVTFPSRDVAGIEESLLLFYLEPAGSLGPVPSAIGRNCMQQWLAWRGNLNYAQLYKEIGFSSESLIARE